MNELDIKFEELCDNNDMPRIIDVGMFKYGPDMFKEFHQDSEKYNSEDWDDVKYILQKHDKFEDFVRNFEKYEIEMDEKDPNHWRNRKKAIDDLTKNFNNL